MMMVLPCDWQITKQKVAQRSQYLFEMGHWSDCKFLVGREPNQRMIEGHKVFLAMSSPVFETMLYNDNAKLDDPIRVEDVSPDAFRALLEYIYTDQVDLESLDLVCELCHCAKKFALPFLVKECVRFLWSEVCPEKACRIYEFSKAFEEQDLMEKCLQVIRLNTDEVLNNNSWNNVSQETLFTILEEDKLYISSELVLFNALERWAKAECNRKSLDLSNSNALRSVIGDALAKIRFLTLTPQEFADGPGKSPLLNQQEAFSLLMNISSPNITVHMPESFSINKQSRTKNLIAQTFNFDNDLMKKSVQTQKLIETHKYEELPINLVTSSSISSDLKEQPDLIVDLGFVKKHLLETETSLCDRNEDLSICRHNINLRRYCLRPVESQTEIYNENTLDCSMTFTVNKNICIMGLQVPSQLLYMPNNNQPHKSSYTEILYAHLLDSFGTRLTYTHFTTKVEAQDLIEVLFNRSVYIQKNKLYKIGVVFNTEGWYPLAKCNKNQICDNVSFCFETNALEVSHDGLIRSIIFTFH